MNKEVTFKLWSEDDIRLLKLIYPSFHNNEIARRLGRTVYAVHAKAGMLGLRKGVISRPDLPYNLKNGIQIEWTAHMIETLKREYSITKNADMAIMLGVSPRSVTRKARELGLSKNKLWFRAITDANRKLAHGINKLCRNKGQFYKGMPPTPTSYKKGHIPASIQPVIRLDTLGIYPSAKEAARDLGCSSTNLQIACYRRGRARGVAVRYCKDMPCGSCRFVVGLSIEQTSEDSICGCGLDSHITTTMQTGCKKYQPNKTLLYERKDLCLSDK